MSYIIPVGETALAAQAHMREVAEKKGLEALVNHAVIHKAEDGAARDADYPVDFIPAATRAGLAGWLSMPFAVVAALYSVFADNVPAAQTPIVLNNQVWVFYGASIIDAINPDAGGELFFGIGTANNRKAQFDLEKLYSKLETDGYFSEPVVYAPQDIVTVQVRARLATGVGWRLQLKTLICEPLQQSVV